LSVIIDGTAGITFPVTAGSASAVQASSGRVLQVVSATSSTLATNSSTSYTQLGPTASITPSNSTSKILVSISFCCGNNTTGLHEEAAVYKNSSILQALGVVSYAQSGTLGSVLSYQYLDSPTTTSSTTYSMYFKNGGGDSGTFTVNPTWTSYGGGFSTITLMEIAV
jgi:hypothetical protein